MDPTPKLLNKTDLLQSKLIKSKTKGTDRINN